METFKKIAPIPYCLHEADDDFFKDPEVRRKTKQSVGLPPPYPADIRMKEGDSIAFGFCELAVIHTPGHTPGSVCLLCEDHLFTGDAVFVGEAGRTDLPGGDLQCLIDSIRVKILPLDKKTVILPGHHHTGEPTWSTLEQEMKTNIHITDFILDE
jgi:glyoxylase-like metal-dependent hydrolase (beta-lactamase superfamily II)